MEGCIFCKIIEGKIPSAKVYETDKVLAFLDINPTSKGHTLIVPKAHHELLVDVPDEMLKDLAVAVKKVANAVKKGTNAGGLNFLLSMEKAAGQTVPHVHFHIIPRHEGDGLKHWPQGKYEEGEAKDYAEKIKRNI